ncbi:hypothetical protein AMJ83_02135 [candidate division WOR_3 bacterium SM23_42]|uniref:DUF6249 domain-containing protein n=1 Tax=candidate division WOR_3 bacterium SM23_42 TaxID=1703779 RepID=A0A0S8FVF0_UNCW3|nr:MAG: hypothetical protein AMJ83_02135 [candidate division WOR_3 bacterium SM23_42]
MDEVGAAALVLALSIPGVIIIIAILAQYLKRKKHYDAMVKAIELGKNADEIKALFAVEERRVKGNGKGLLKGGIIVTGLGVGLALMAIFLPAGATSGLLASFVLIAVLGLSLVAAYLIARKKDKSE